MPPQRDKKLKPRLSITTKLLLSLLAPSVISLGVVAALALSDMRDVSNFALESQTCLGDNAVADSTDALEGLAEDELLRLAEDQAIISNALFERVQGAVGIVAQFVSDLWSDPSAYGSRPSYSPQEEPPDIYAASVYLGAPGTHFDASSDEVKLSSNLDEIFSLIYAHHPDIRWLYMGMESGLFRVYPWVSTIDPSFDARQRPWYTGGTEAGRLGWTDTYVDAATGTLMVTCFRPVYTSQGQFFIGVIGADVTLQTINDRITNTQVGELGYAFLIDDYGHVLARPGLSPGDTRWDESFEMEDLLNSDNPGLKAIAEDMTAGNSGITRCAFEDGDRYVAYAPVTSPGWSLGIVMPVGEVIAPALATKDRIVSTTLETSAGIDGKIGSTQTVFIGVFVGIFLVICGVAFLLARMLTKPIKALARGSEAVGGGDLDYRVEVKTGDELEELADSFNKMTSDLKEYTEELRRTTAEKERFARELEIASGIQQSFLPEAPPEVEGFELAALSTPATEVGGDFYDFIPVSTDEWGLVIADVSGKGVPAALFMALSRTLVRANAVGNPSASDAIRRANTLIAEDDRSSMFVTLFYGVLDPGAKVLTYVSAGHNPPLMFPGGGGDTIMLKAKGVALGIMPDIDREEKEIPVGPGDLVVLYTDGVTEAINQNEEQFGQERLARIVEQNRHLPAAEIARQIERAVAEFSEGQPQFDDITVVVLKGA